MAGASLPKFERELFRNDIVVRRGLLALVSPGDKVTTPVLDVTVLASVPLFAYAEVTMQAVITIPLMTSCLAIL
jgi:hypothetical protein